MTPSKNNIFYRLCFKALLICEIYLFPLSKYFRRQILKFKTNGNNHKTKFGKSRKLNKIPAHLALSVGPGSELKAFGNRDIISNYLDRVANVVFWASLLDIEFFTIFDSKGFFKSQIANICESLTKNFQHCEIANCNTIICTKNKDLHRLNSGGSELTVFVRCREDGKKLICLATEDIQKLKSPTRMNEKLFDYHLNKFLYPGFGKTMDQSVSSKFNPDLLMILGNSSTLTGFLPWHIPNTEIHLHPDLLDFNFEDFDNSIRIFSNCEQRFGK